MAGKNLLVICNTFPDESDTYIGAIFVKDQLSCLSEYFEKIYVLIPAPLSITTVRKIPLKDYNFQNIHVHFIKYVDFPPCYFYFRDLWVKRETSKVLSFIQQNEIHFDLIHAHNTWRAGTIAIELKKIFKVPVVLTEHTSNVLIDRWINRRDPQYAKTWKECDAIIRVNRKDTYIFEQANVPKERVYSIPNGFKKDFFYPLDTKTSKETVGFPTNKKILLSVGALSPTKGYSNMIKSMKKITNTRKDIHYYIIGSGDLRKTLEKQVSQMGLRDYITFVGGKRHGEIHLWINACDLFVLPSINEANPTVMFEALGCGKPMVGTKIGGVPEIITSNKYGLLVEPSDSEDLTEKVLMGLEMEWDRKKIIAYAEQFTWENISKQILQIYQKVGMQTEHDFIMGD